MSRLLERAVRAAVRRPGRMLAAAAALAAACAVLALSLEPSAATDTLVGRGSPTYQATERYRHAFGDHAVAVLVREDLPHLVLTPDLNRLVGLEGCLSGNKPPRQAAPGGPRSPCAQLARDKPVQVVYGPGTFINTAIGDIQDQLRAQLRERAAQARSAAAAARAVARREGRPAAVQDRVAREAEQLVYAAFARDLFALSSKYGLGLNGVPKLNDPNFIATLVFDPSRGPREPKARFAYLFPSDRSALIQVRLKPDLSQRERGRAIALVRAAVRMPQWRLAGGGSYVVTGVPVLAEDLTDALAGSTLRLLVVALVVMAAVLALVFRARARLVPLAVALGAVAIAFGALALVRAPLTMASIAVLPVLLGLAVDYAIQYQARVQEERASAAEGGRGDEHTKREADLRAARIAGPTIATAALATGAGFLVLLLSPVPMVRGFGSLLVLGVAVALGLALTAGTAALALVGRGGGDGWLARSLRGAGELVDAAAGLARAPARRAARAGGAVLRAAVRRPERVLAVALVAAAAGWAVDSRAEVVSDLQRLVPQDLPSVRDLNTLQADTGVAGEVDVVIHGRDLAEPRVVQWMTSYQAGVLKRAGYSSKQGCGRADVCPALALPDLFRTAGSAASAARVRELLAAIPPYFSQAVITRDHRTATLAFGIRLGSLAHQQKVIGRMRAALKPPPGVSAELAGIPVLAAEANAALSDPWRRLGTLAAALAAVALALWAVYRRWERAWVPLVPIALAGGWSALVLWLLGIPLNPLSATLGALVIAISTEFAVLLAARFREERAAGWEPAAALRRTYRSTGAAVAASGTTAIAGFAVLIASDVRMLRDFGIVTVVDLTVSLLGVLAVLPAVLVLAERRAARGAAARPGRRERAAVPA
jgi:hydrophobe/amphiphile efflux-3 (HAE3) family protein